MFCKVSAKNITSREQGNTDFFDRVLHDISHGHHGFGLTHSMNSTECLLFRHRIPLGFQ